MPWSRWATSLVVHLAVMAAILAIRLGVRQTLEMHQEGLAVQLIAPRLTPPAPVRQIYTHAAVKQTPPDSHRVKFEAPLIEHQARVVEKAQIEEPKMEAAPLPRPLPAVKLELPALPGPQPSRAIKVGGFGDPKGVHASETSSRKGLVVAQTGAFDLPTGPAAGRGGGGKAQAVALAGFGDASGGTGSQEGSRQGGQVRSAGFSDYQNAAPVHAAPISAPAVTPVEILSKPKPVYTEAARERHLEGEVQLDVLFRATGRAEVLRVIRGLGLGLDEAAGEAASQIRFRPGTRDGTPVDMRGIVHIVFQLS